MTRRRRRGAAEEYVRAVEATAAAIESTPRPSTPAVAPEEMPPPRSWGRVVADRLDGWLDVGRGEPLWAYEERGLEQ